MGQRRGLRYERDRPSKRMTILVISGPLSKPKSELCERAVRHLAPRSIATLKIAEGDVDSTQGGGDDQSWEMCPCCTSEDSLFSTIYTIRSTINPDILLIDLNAEGTSATVYKNLRNLPHADFQILPSVLVTNSTGLANLRTSYDNRGGILHLGAIFHVIDQSVQSQPATHDAGSAIIFEHVDDFTTIVNDWEMAFDNRERKTSAGELRSEEEACFLLESPRCDGLTDLIDFARLILTYRFGCVTMFQGIIRYGDQEAILDVCDGQFRISGAEATQGATAIVRGLKVNIESLAANLRTAYRETLPQHL